MFAGGSKGANVKIPSANPSIIFTLSADPRELPTVTIDGKLFLPAKDHRQKSGKFPLVMVVPGSLGVAPSHLAHAEALVGDGFAAFVLDSFGARDVTSTVANQTQFSFASSAYDVLAAWKVLAAHPQIDAARIGAQGHSRGGSAVMTAATRRFADAVVGKDAGFSSVLAAYPWSGHQFLDPTRRRYRNPCRHGRCGRMVFADAGARPLPGDPPCRRQGRDAADRGRAPQLRSRHRNRERSRGFGLACSADGISRRRWRLHPSAR